MSTPSQKYPFHSFKLIDYTSFVGVISTCELRVKRLPTKFNF